MYTQHGKISKGNSKWKNKNEIFAAISSMKFKFRAHKITMHVLQEHMKTESYVTNMLKWLSIVVSRDGEEVSERNGAKRKLIN